MSSPTQADSSDDNPNFIPLGLSLCPDSKLAMRSARALCDHGPSTSRRSRSPVRPFRQLEIIQDENHLAKQWAADKEELYNQIEKLTLKLDTANVQASLQKTRIKDLEEQSKSNQKLIEEYQKRLRKELVNLGEEVKKREEVIEKSERFQKEIVKLSHRLHYLDPGGSRVNEERIGAIKVGAVDAGYKKERKRR